MHHFLTHALGCCRPCTVHQIISYGEVKLVGCGKTCVPCKDHHIMFAHAVGEPYANCGPPEIMESSPLNACSLENFVELSPEIVYDLETRISESPLSF